MGGTGNGSPNGGGMFILFMRCSTCVYKAGTAAIAVATHEHIHTENVSHIEHGVTRYGMKESYHS